MTSLLTHDSRIVVVSTLVLIGYLEEKLRDLVSGLMREKKVYHEMSAA